MWKGEKQFTRKDWKHWMTTVEKIHEFSLPETSRAVNAVKIMNFPDLKYFLVFTFFSNSVGKLSRFTHKKSCRAN